MESAIPYIPQKAPFVMIDELIDSNEELTRSSFTIKDENVLTVAGRFSEAGLLENIAQTAALRAGYNASKENRPVEVGYIGAVSSFEVFDLPVTGDKLLTEISITDKMMGVSMVSGKVYCEGKLIAQCDMRVFGNAAP